MKQIELLLLDNVDNLGIVGDVVKVRPGYARNFLLPRALATTPTPGSIERLAERRAEVEAEMKAIRKSQEELIGKLDGYELTLERSANEQGVLFGGVSQHDIAEALREAGFAVEDRWIRIGQQIKRLDSYAIPVVVDKELKTEVKLWVVSDKPVEELAAEAGEAEETEEAGGEEEAADSASGYQGRNE
ncbi:MAG: 50S ribosomal protein L9 [Phycisphaeraceae bacterium]